MIITASHQKGGVGKSTLVWNLIIEYAKTRKVYVVDLDMQKTITYSLQIRKKNHDCTNIILLNPKDKDGFISMVKKLNKSDLLFIDSGGFDSAFNRIAIAVSNIILTPVSSKFYELLGLKEYERILKQLSEKLNKQIVTHVILNKINPNVKDVREIIEFINKSPYFKLMNCILRQRVVFENSPGEGKSIVEYEPEGKGALEFLRFKKELNMLL